MFVDSASRLQRPYGTRNKSAAAILAVVKRFIAGMGVPRTFRSDNEREYTNRSFVEYCNNLGIRRELTAPYTPQQNGSVASALWRAFKAGHEARLGVSNLYPDIRLNEVAGSTDAAATSLWMESLLWALEGFNRPATAVNDGSLSHNKIFYGNRPPLPLLSFFQPAYHRVPRQQKRDPRARLCLELRLSSRARLPQTAGCGDGKGRIFARRYVALFIGAVEPFRNCNREFAHCATGEYILADANAYARRRRARARSRFSTACSFAGSVTDVCPRSCADTRTTDVTTVCTYLELPVSDPPMR